MEFKDRLELAIKESGKTQRDIGIAAGFSESNMSHFIRGERKPGVDSLAKLLDALPEINARWLITGKR